MCMREEREKEKERKSGNNLKSKYMVVILQNLGNYKDVYAAVV